MMATQTISNNSLNKNKYNCYIIHNEILEYTNDLATS